MDLNSLFKDALRPPWNLVLGVVGLILGLVPRVLEFGSGWQDFRSGRKRMEDEKRRLELLKLRYEIEAFKAQHSLPDLDPSPAKTVPLAQALRRQPELRPIPKWQRSYPRFAVAILALIQVLVGIFAVIGAIMAIAGPFIMLDDKEDKMSGGEIALLDFIYILMTSGSVIMFRAIGRWKKNIILSTRPVSSAGAPSP
jgi:hypothetical protein